MNKIACLALLSGGLDSRLAIRLMQEQGIEVEALNFRSCFCTCTPKSSCQSEAHKAHEQLGVPLRVIDTTERFIEIVKHPKHGYGRHMNPCLDCRILMLSTSRESMEEAGASFIVTGEVLGQRPMSQRLDAMRVIDREAGVEGLVLRPLSAKHLRPTIPEQRGWVDREKLLGLSGRSRKEQIRLAQQYSITDYPCAAGGCLLTAEGFACKVRDLIAHKDAGINDFMLLRVGRHFRLPHGGKAVIGRNEADNTRLGALARAGDLIFDRTDDVGPTGLLRDSTHPDDVRTTAALVASHSKLGSRVEAVITVRPASDERHPDTLYPAPLPRATVDSLRI